MSCCQRALYDGGPLCVQKLPSCLPGSHFKIVRVHLARSATMEGGGMQQMDKCVSVVSLWGHVAETQSG